MVIFTLYSKSLVIFPVYVSKIYRQLHYTSAHIYRNIPYISNHHLAYIFQLYLPIIFRKVSSIYIYFLLSYSLYIDSLPIAILHLYITHVYIDFHSTLPTFSSYVHITRLSVALYLGWLLGLEFCETVV